MCRLVWCFVQADVVLFALPSKKKESFWLAKGLVLYCKRTPFTLQKDSFCKLKGLHFYCPYIYSPKSVSRMSPFFVRVSWKAKAARRAQGSCPCDAMR